jgi:hypothetical protein
MKSRHLSCFHLKNLSMTVCHQIFKPDAFALLLLFICGFSRILLRWVCWQWSWDSLGARGQSTLRTDSPVIGSKKLDNCRQYLKRASTSILNNQIIKWLLIIAALDECQRKTNTLVLKWSVGSQEPIFNKTVKAAADAKPNSRVEANTRSNCVQRSKK